MDIVQQHEIFEIEVLEKLKNNQFLDPLAFGGGTMLRLCHDLPRYSADLDFWIVKDVEVESYFNHLRQFIDRSFEITDVENKVLGALNTHDLLRAGVV